MPTRGIYLYWGNKGRPRSHFAEAIIENPLSMAALTTLRGVLNEYTLCNTATQTFQEKAKVDSGAPGGTVNVDKKAIIYFRHPTTLRVHHYTIPAPNPTYIELVDEGERMTDAAVAAIVAGIATATGISYAPMYGVIEQAR